MCGNVLAELSNSWEAQPTPPQLRRASLLAMYNGAADNLWEKGGPGCRSVALMLSPVTWPCHQEHIFNDLILLPQSGTLTVENKEGNR